MRVQVPPEYQLEFLYTVFELLIRVDWIHLAQGRVQSLQLASFSDGLAFPPLIHHSAHYLNNIDSGWERQRQSISLRHRVQTHFGSNQLLIQSVYRALSRVQDGRNMNLTTQIVHGTSRVVSK